MTGAGTSPREGSRHAALSPTRTIERAKNDGSARLVLGDVLEVAGALHEEGLAGQVSLVYLDPPYASQADYVHEARLDGGADGRRRRALAYEDSWSPSEYLDMLAPRLDALAGLLSSRGTIWVQVDWRASHFVRLLLDEIMGPQRFMNEIVWKRAPNLGRQAASSQFGRTLDTIIVYGNKDAKLTPPTRLEPIDEKAIRWDEQGRPNTLAPRGDYTDLSVARLEKEGRIHRTTSGKVYIKYFLVKNEDGAWCRERRVDALWTDVAPLRHAKLGERTGYPTQKPRALLERVIAAGSAPGDLVVDLFCGSGTTADAAHALGRRAVVGDRAPIAITNARARLLRSGVDVSVEACGDRALPHGDELRVTIARAKEGEVTVNVDAPTEPLAWAAGPIAEDGALERTAHASRIPGAQAVAAATQLTFAHAPARPLGVRVYEDDGRATAITLEPSRLPPVGNKVTVSTRNRGQNP